jgi:hypothetical protein
LRIKVLEKVKAYHTIPIRVFFRSQDIFGGGRKMSWLTLRIILGYFIMITIALGGSLLSVYMGWSFLKEFGAPEMTGIFSLIQGALAVLSLVVALIAFRELYHMIQK